MKELFSTMKKSLLFALLFPCSFAMAQQDLSLASAIEKALENNYQIKLVKANYDITQVQNTWGMAGMVPTVSLNLNNTNQLTNNTNNPASFFPGVVLVDNVGLNLDMSWTIFAGYGIRINKERFDQLEEQTKGNVIVAIESTIYDVIIAYFNAVTQSRKIAILEEMIDFSQKKYEYFKLKSDLGAQSSIDLLEFRNLVLNDSSNLLLQKFAYNNAMRNLNLEMGVAFDETFRLTDSIEFDVPKASWQELYEYMVANNQNIKNQYIAIELQRLNTEQKQSAMFPVVNLNLGANPSVGHIELFGDTPFSTNTNSMNYYGNISVRYNLFNGYQRQRNIEIAKIQENITALQTEDIVMTLTNNLRTIFELYQTQSKIEDMALERVKNGSAIWKMGIEDYNIGNLRFYELNDIKVRYEQAVLNYYDRLYDLLKTHFDLMRITGTITQEYNVAESVVPKD